RRLERLERDRTARLDARCAVRAAEPQLVQEVDVREEALVGDDVRDARLRIKDALELCAERAVLIRADRANEAEAVTEGGLLLRVNTEGLVHRLKRVASGLHRRLPDRLSARRQIRSGRVHAVVLDVRIVEAEGRLEIRRRRGLPGGIAHELRGEVAEVRVRLTHDALARGSRVRTLGEAAGQDE